MTREENQTATGGQVSPYIGLRAFTPNDAPLFFGREAETEILTERLHDPSARFVVIVGAAGVGKSSLVGAGLLPRLTAENSADNMRWVLPQWNNETRQWIGLRFTPGEAGDNPFVALANQIAPLMSGEQARDLATKLNNTPDAIAGIIQTLLRGKPDSAEAVVVIDQFEELFALVHERYVAPFVELLATLVKSQTRTRVVVALRAEYYARCVALPALADLFSTASFPLSSPDAAAIEKMVTEPAKRANITFEDRLVERIVRDTGSESGSLALMAYALDELYRTGGADNRLHNSEYERTGGVQKAIDKQAESVFTKLDEAAQATFASVFKELCVVDEVGNTLIRRTSLNRAARTPDARQLIDALVNARLLTTSAAGVVTRAAVFGAAETEDAEAHASAQDMSADLGVRLARPIVQPDDKTTVEIVHEVVLHAWDRLTRWTDSAQDDLRLLRQIRDLADKWRRSNYDSTLLLTGTRLETARGWLADATLTAIQQDYVSASARADDEKRAQDRRIAQQVKLFGRVRNGLIFAALLALGVIVVAATNVQSATYNMEFARTGQALAAEGISWRMQTVQAIEQTLTLLPPTLAAAMSELEQVNTRFDEYERLATEALTPVPLTLTAANAELATAQAEATNYALVALQAPSLSAEQRGTAEIIRTALQLLTTTSTFTPTLTPTATPTLQDSANVLSSGTPTSTWTATATFDATLNAVATNPGSAILERYDPIDGTLVHDADDSQISSYIAPVQLSDFIAEVRFFNPYDSTEGDWDYALFFRGDEGGNYRLILRSTRQWALSQLQGVLFTTLQGGFLPSSNFDTTAGGYNDLRLVVRGRGAQFYVNDTYIAQLDVSQRWIVGEIQVVTGAYTGDEINGQSTRFENFVVQSLDGLPTPTLPPDPTPEIIRTAQLGQNIGEIALGESEVWSFEGTAGEQYTFIVAADKPAGGLTSAQERLEQGLMDTFLIVRSPSGYDLVRNDDDTVLPESTVEHTNSRAVVILPGEPGETVSVELEVSGYNNDSAGSYRLLIYEGEVEQPLGDAVPTRLPITQTPNPTFFVPSPLAPTQVSSFSTESPLFTATASRTPTPDLTLAAVEASPSYLTTFGPVSGALEHNASDNQVATYEADGVFGDFEVQARFFNPYGTDEGTWDYGFFFRDTQSSQYRVNIQSNRVWELQLYDNDKFITQDSGTLPSANFDTSADGFNDMRLFVRGRGAQFFVNDKLIAELDVAAGWIAGNISIGTGFYTGNEIDGKTTRYEDFTVRTFEQALAPPSPTPSLTPESGQTAQLGENRGEIVIGGGQVWTFNGTRGQLLRIRVEADRPARTGEDVERDDEGFDTLLIVHGINGAQLAQDDDIEDGVITNSLIERVRLPSDGEYQIEVRSWDNQSGGTYTLIIEEIE